MGWTIRRAAETAVVSTASELALKPHPGSGNDRFRTYDFGIDSAKLTSALEKNFQIGIFFHCF
jgi:hypothetical protein